MKKLANTYDCEFKPLQQLIFYGIQSQIAGKEKLDIVCIQQKSIKNLQFVFINENII